MNNTVNIISDSILNKGYNIINQHIKILLYKQNEKIFEILDFENDSIYNEPLLISYFSKKREETEMIDNIISGYSMKNIKFNLISDEFGRIYMPNYGWIITQYKNQLFHYLKISNKLFKDNIEVDFFFEELEIIENTKIEVLKYSIPLLKSNYFNVDKEFLNVEIENVSKKQIMFLTSAYNLIKKYIPEQYKLIERYAPKCVVFNIDTYQRNSFATFSAHGVSFYNSYQNDYDEVFFIDDIAHQTGHVIMNTILFNNEDFFFKINKNTILEVINSPDGSFVENRDLYVIFHALYTYYTSFICLDKCLENNVFERKQKHEAIGRIAFYINKCYRDLLLIDNPINASINANEYFTKDGLLIYNELKNKWFEMYNKWFEITKHFNMSNQPYNFTYSKFLELNPIKND